MTETSPAGESPDAGAKPDGDTRPEEGEARILKLLSGAPAQRILLYRTLEFCRTPKTAVQIEAAIAPQLRTSVFSPAVVCQWLEEAGGLERAHLGEENDEFWTTTDAGKRAVESCDLFKQLRRLIDKETTYQSIYLQLLDFCATPRTKEEIERMLENNPLLKNPRLYSTSFLAELENVGAIEWNGKWQTTNLGKEASAQGGAEQTKDVNNAK